MQLNWPSPPAAFSPCRRTTIVSLLVSLLVWLLLADDEAGLPESLHPIPAKPSASESPIAHKTVRTVGEGDELLGMINISGTSFATRQQGLDSSDESPTNSASTDIT